MLELDELDIFTLKWQSYDENEYYYFIGPATCSEDDFGKICDELMDQAALNAIGPTRIGSNSSYVSLRDIIEELSVLLEDKGFISFGPKTKEYYDGNMFLSPIPYERKDCHGFISKELHDKIISYNEDICNDKDKIINDFLLNNEG